MAGRDLCIMACVFCRDPAFWRWMSGLAVDGPVLPGSEGAAKAFILSLSGVASRNDLDASPEAAARFHERVRGPFVAWKAERHEQATGRAPGAVL